jgi:hypothetical protein
MNRVRAVIGAALVGTLASSGCSKKDAPQSSATPGASASAQAVLASATAAVLSAARPAMPAATAGEAPPAACSLMTDDDMTAALVKVFAKKPFQPASPYPTVSTCGYHSEGLTLSLKTETLDRAGFNQTTSNVSGGEDVPGVGDAAYYHALENMNVVIGTFIVLKGKTLLSMTYGGLGMDKSKALATEKALAARLLPKL